MFFWSVGNSMLSLTSLELVLFMATFYFSAWFYKYFGFFINVRAGDKSKRRNWNIPFVQLNTPGTYDIKKFQDPLSLPKTDRYPLKEKGEEGAGNGGSPLSEREREQTRVKGAGWLAAPLPAPLFSAHISEGPFVWRGRYVCSTMKEKKQGFHN